MKKFALSLIIASAAVFGVGSATSAQYDTTTTDANSGANVPTTTVAPATTTTVPATTPAAGLPATGSGGIGTTTGIAIGLLAVGLGLFIVTRVRRSQPGSA